MNPIVIIGSGLAGYSAARELRKHDKSTPLLLITRDDSCNYYKPDLSEAFSKGKLPKDLIKQMAATLGADIRTHANVCSIDRVAREVCMDGITLPYSALILANGAETIEAPLAGDGAEFVCRVNNYGDYVALRRKLDAARQVTVIGAGLIGCEFSNDLASHGIAVDCVDPVTWPSQRFLPAACGEAVRAGLAPAGVNWHLGHTVKTVSREASGMRVELDDDSSVGADVVLSAIRLRPSVALAQHASLEVARGVVTDRELRTSDTNIYAIGDCAEVDGLFRPFVSPLMQAARALGRTLAGEPKQVRYPALPIIVKTPACPAIVYPPVIEDDNWVVEREASGFCARYMRTDDRLMGFALTGAAARNRGSLFKLSPPMLD